VAKARRRAGQAVRDSDGGAADSPGRGGEAPDRVRVLGFGVVTAGELWRAFLRYRGGQGVTGGPTTGGHPTVGRA
jgi:hypothetical protein